MAREKKVEKLLYHHYYQRKTCMRRHFILYFVKNVPRKIGPSLVEESTDFMNQ